MPAAVRTSEPSPAGDEPLHVDLELEARTEAVAVARQATGAMALLAGFDDVRLEDVRLAVSEACTNVVVHAYDGRPGPMWVRLRLDARALVVSVLDEGGGLRPAPMSPGLGVGLPLMESVASHLELGPDDDGRFAVAMTFLLDDTPPLGGAA